MEESLAAVEVQRSLSISQINLSRMRAASERAKLRATADGLARQESDLLSQIKFQQQSVDSTESTLDRMKPVLIKGFISQIEYEKWRQGMLMARQKLALLQQQHSALSAERQRTIADLASLDADAAIAIAAAQSAGQSLNDQRARLESERSYAIVAPISGRVTALQAEIGRTVDASMPLMIIVPDGASLHADVYAPTRAIGFVRPGQEVRLLYDAFPHSRYGSFKGRVHRITRNVLDPREVATPLKLEEAVYRIEIKPEWQNVEAFGQRISLKPGMTLKATLILDRQSFADWLLQPIRATMHRNH